MYQSDMSRSTNALALHCVLFGFWPNGFSSLPVVSNTSVYNKVIVKCAIKLQAMNWKYLLIFIRQDILSDPPWTNGISMHWESWKTQGLNQTYWYLTQWAMRRRAITQPVSTYWPNGFQFNPADSTSFVADSACLMQFFLSKISLERIFM